MGGDHGPSVVVPGVAYGAEQWRARGVRFLLHGDQARIEAELAQAPAARAFCEIRHTDKMIAMDAKPAQAMRRGAGSSLWNAIESVHLGEAQAAVSSGNTGALMAIARLILRMVGDLKRPALVGMWPTPGRPCSVLDVGANVDCDASDWSSSRSWARPSTARCTRPSTPPSPCSAMAARSRRAAMRCARPTPCCATTCWA